MSQLQRWYTERTMSPAQHTSQRTGGQHAIGHGDHPWRSLPWHRLLAVLTLLCGCPLLVVAQSSPESPTTIPSPATVAPLETMPPLQERLLAPIPESFNWLQRDVRSNALLSSLAGMFAGQNQLLLAVSLTEEYSDNFSRSRDVRRDDYRTRASIGVLYHLEEGPAFVSLASTLSATYQARTEESNFGFANASLNAGYRLPRLFFGLTESFVRDDETSDESAETASRAIRRGRGVFVRHHVSPQVSYEISPITSVNAGYTNNITRDEGDVEDDLNSPVPSQTHGNSVSHGFSTGLKHAFSPLLTAAVQYAYTQIDNENSADTVENNAQANMAYQFTAATSAILRVFGRITDRSIGELDSQTYGLSLGMRHVLAPALAIDVAVGPTFLEREGEGQRVLLNWQINLDGAIPIFQTNDTILTLSTQQGVDDTSTDVDNVGLVLRQSVVVNLSHVASNRLRASLYANYTRTEPLEKGGTNEALQQATDNFWSAGARATYLLTRVVSLHADYRYQRRDSSRATDNFDENRVTVSVSGNMPVF